MGIFRCNHFIKCPDETNIILDMNFNGYRINKGIIVQVKGLCVHCKAYVRTDDFVNNLHLYLWHKSRIEGGGKTV